EKHYGEGDGTGERVLNPETIVNIEDGGYMEMETTQIKGVDSTKRTTKAILEDNATLVIKEKIMTHGSQSAETEFEVDLNGENSSTNVISRSVAKDNSKQVFLSKINGNNKCAGHTECDAIIMDNACVKAIPEITANNIDASLIHEAAIGKIAGEQLIKLMTLGLTEKEAEEQIVSGFLK
ncbi:MAG: SufD family Fe-S cluster assembly protein, partial [Clostridium butyricum]|nr:SufD family Fe-S cluster assembly protein [Clostridium butyricum]